MNKETVSRIMLALFSVGMLICVFPQTLHVGLALQSPVEVTLEELKTNSSQYVNKTIEVTGKIVGISLICPDNSTHRIYQFSDDTDVVNFLWFPELLSGWYKAVGSLTYHSGPMPSINPCGDYMKGIVWWVTPEGYYDWRIKLTSLAVGGYIVLIDKTELTPSPWTPPLIVFVSLVILASAISVVYVKHRKKKQT